LVSLIIVCIAWQGAAIQKILMKTNDKTYVWSFPCLLLGKASLTFWY
jgi:hypothetical protein